jgi:hypothetical protein
MEGLKDFIETQFFEVPHRGIQGAGFHERKSH